MPTCTSAPRRKASQDCPLVRAMELEYLGMCKSVKPGIGLFNSNVKHARRFQRFPAGARLACRVCSLLCLITNAGLAAQTGNWPEIQQRYKHGVEALQSGQDGVAEKEFREILRLDPKNASAYANLGVINFHHGEFKQAAKEFRAALDIQPSLWNAAAYLGMSEFSMGNNDEAKPLLENAFEHVQEAKLRNQVGIDLITVYKAANDSAHALDVTRALIQAQPNDPATLFVAYRAFSDLAAQTLSKLAEVAPESPQMHQALAQALASQDDFQGAIAQYRRALKLDPHLAAAHFGIGQLTLANSPTEEARQMAEKEFQTVLSADPKNAESLYMLGEIEWMRAKPQEALDLYERALDARPGFVDAHIAAGKALTNLGRTDEALKHLLEAIHLDPQNEVAHYKLFEAYLKLRRTQDAERELATFRTLRDSHGSAKSLYQQVQGDSIPQQVVAPSEPQ